MARGEAIPRDVRAFVGAHVHSITQLELLMLLHASPDRAFTAAQASRELRAPERFLAGQLVDLTAAGAVVADDGDPPAWRIAARGPHAGTIDDLAQCVRHRKRAVHDLILSGPSSDVQVFSDAFRLRRRRD